MNDPLQSSETIPEGPHGLWAIELFTTTPKPGVGLRAFCQPISNYRNFITVCAADSLHPLADAYWRGCNDAAEAAWWLATLVATRLDMSLDDFEIKYK